MSSSSSFSKAAFQQVNWNTSSGSSPKNTVVYQAGNVHDDQRLDMRSASSQTIEPLLPPTFSSLSPCSSLPSSRAFNLLRIVPIWLWDPLALAVCITITIAANVAEPRYSFVPRSILDSVSYPTRSNTVPSWSVPVYSIIGPILIFLFAKATNINNQTVQEFFRLCLTLIFAVFLTGAVTNAIKSPIGRLRPNFAKHCWPDGNIVFASEDSVGGYPVCSCDQSMDREIRKSFPSGHSSWSAAGLGFLSLWLLGQTRALSQSLSAMAIPCMGISNTTAIGANNAASNPIISNNMISNDATAAAANTTTTTTPTTTNFNNAVNTITNTNPNISNGHGKNQVVGGTLTLTLVSLSPALGAVAVGITRIVDYWHHPSDVLAGLLIGFLIAYLSYRLEFPPVTSPYCHLPTTRIMTSTFCAAGGGDSGRREGAASWFGGGGGGEGMERRMEDATMMTNPQAYAVNNSAASTNNASSGSNAITDVGINDTISNNRRDISHYMASDGSSAARELGGMTGYIARTPIEGFGYDSSYNDRNNNNNHVSGISRNSHNGTSHLAPSMREFGIERVHNVIPSFSSSAAAVAAAAVTSIPSSAALGSSGGGSAKGFGSMGGSNIY
eukprot:CAMPEP_0175052716 /NCGR_PEP_ID=MMETSP0052_2-20121109/8513_1 /TAXON_ID=51329 ORGANISM="Polytomella parva, Strain SAG 63-3" /NCGR_SAMPLE_ID=MMETSP0052_2 /ASSEMBLY_ACC=CAM_ASM_000194 /LENGTH=611 /DNA_ID=CAMNT_0016317149 /DNA_START=192 /DNA_END=2027 /DNA_ORIENTATION=-